MLEKCNFLTDRLGCRIFFSIGKFIQKLGIVVEISVAVVPIADAFQTGAVGTEAGQETLHGICNSGFYQRKTFRRSIKEGSAYTARTDSRPVHFGRFPPETACQIRLKNPFLQTGENACMNLLIQDISQQGINFRQSKPGLCTEKINKPGVIPTALVRNMSGKHPGKFVADRPNGIL